MSAPAKLALIVACLVARCADAANTEPAPPPAANSLEVSKPEWRPFEDDPLPAGAICRMGRARGRHGIEHFAATPDGKYLVAGFGDRSVRIWEADSGKLLRAFKPLGSIIRRVAVSPNGKFIAAASSASVHLWDVADASDTPRTLQSHQSQVMDLAFSSDGALLLSGGYHKVAHLWNVAEGKLVREFPSEQQDGITSVAFTRDDKAVLIGNQSGLVKLWNLANSEFIRSFEGLKSPASLHVLPDGKTLAAISWQEGALLWDLPSGKLKQRLNQFEGYGAFSLDGSLLATVKISFPADSPIQIYDLKSEKIRQTLPGHRTGTYLLAFSPDNKTLTTYGNDRTLRRWDIDSGKELGPLVGHQNNVTGLGFVADGQQVVSSSQDGTVRFWDAQNGKELLRLASPKEHFSSMAVSANGKLVAVAGDAMRRWRWEQNDPNPSFNLRIWNVSDGKEQYRHHLAGVSLLDLQFTSANDEVLAASGVRCRFWNIKSGQQRGSIPDATQTLRTALLSPDGKYVVTSTDEPALRQVGRIAYWNSGKSNEIFGRSFMFAGFNSVAISPDGKWLAVTGTGNRTENGLSLWETPTDKVVRQFATTRFDISKVAFSPDGRLLAAADPDGIAVFETATGQQRRRFSGGHTQPVQSMVFSPDSRRLATAGDDTLVVVWAVLGREKPQMLESRDLDSAWSILADLDAEKSGQMIARLATNPKQSVPYLKQRLGVLSGEKLKQIEELVLQLDSNFFRVRDRAAKELDNIGEAAIPALSRAANTSRSVEVRTQAERLIKKLGPGEDPATSAVARRSLRAIEILEHAATPEALQVLKEIQDRGVGQILHSEAEKSLKRLATRQAH